MLNRINSKANDNFIAFFKKEEGKREQVAHKISNFFWTRLSVASLAERSDYARRKTRGRKSVAFKLC